MISFRHSVNKCLLPQITNRLTSNLSAMCLSTAAADNKVVSKYDDYQKEMRLKQIERAFDEAMPKLLHGSYNNLVAFLDRNSFRFEDKVWLFESDSIHKTVFRMAKVRLYLAFKSPHNRFETLGTHICLDENLVTLIWQLSWPKNAKSAYLLSPKSLAANFSATFTGGPRSQIGRIEHKLTTSESSDRPPSNAAAQNGREIAPLAPNSQKEDLSTRHLTRVEQCLDVHVNDIGLVNRLVVRPVTSHDFEMAKMRKTELENEIDEQWRRATQKEQQNE
ncbi:hypothetical protein niasHS_013104 [Heterodera schachtii]|uniref:Uncharacterized protein n=1 Tax=Heterodera schachtii TaxID=97005 RepID=A0ABD2IIN5_HETSC